jgi:fatty acid desaturase
MLFVTHPRDPEAEDAEPGEITAPEDGSADRAEARAVARAFEQALRADPGATIRERRAGLLLACEWLAILAVTYGIVYGVRPPGLKIALLLPWSLYASFALDNVMHYANHWPLFRSATMNALFRASGALVFFNPLETRAIHNAHHRAYNRADHGERVFGPEDRDKSFLVYLLAGTLAGLRLLVPFRPLDPAVLLVGKRRPEELREIRVLRWAATLWFGLLAALDWRDTLFYFVPAVLLVGSFGSLVMNLTDHIPGDPRHPLRIATYDEPRTNVAELCSALGHQTCATHLTHHLFPRVHWIHLRALQRRLLPIYERNGAPRSLLVNSTLMGNPLRLLSVVRAVSRMRFDGA